MKPIANWENVKENSGVKRLAPGGYFVKILKVENIEDKQYLKIYFDIADGPEKGCFKKQYDEDNRGENKKWPNAGTFVRSYKDSAASMFRGFTNAIESSNKGYHWDWQEQTLVNKFVGVVIGNEQYQNQRGQVRERNYVVAIRSIETIKKGDFKIPELKKLDATKTTVKPQEAFVNPFSDDNAASGPFAVNDTVEDDSNPWDDDSNPFA